MSAGSLNGPNRRLYHAPKEAEFNRDCSHCPATNEEASRGKAKDCRTLAAEQGVKPVEDFDQFLDEMSGVWPADENLDDFLDWLREQRREGRGSSIHAVRGG